MKIVMIGAGNVATHLTLALQQKEQTILQVYSRTEVSASALAELTDCAYTCNVQDINTDADLYIISVKDSVLSDLLPQIVRINPNALFVHTAGSVPMDIWKGLTHRYGVLYPMQTFSKQRPADFDKVSFFVEANTPEDEQLLMNMAHLLSNHVYPATSEQRRYLHIAAVFACNFANHMYAISNYLLTEHQLPFEAMFPLIDETAQKIHQLSPVDAQTGPAQRGDCNVMNSHLQLLEAYPELQQIYKSLSKNIQQYNLLKDHD